MFRMFRMILLVCALLTWAFAYAQQAESDSSANRFLRMQNGYVDVGSEYGLNPLIVIDEQPALNFFTRGGTGLDVKQLPFRMSWSYNTNPAMLGINNYFRVEFDARTYMDRLEQAKGKQLNEIGKRKDSLMMASRHLQQKMMFLQSMSPKSAYSSFYRQEMERVYKQQGRKLPPHQMPDTTLLWSPQDVQQHLPFADIAGMPQNPLDLNQPSVEWLQWYKGYRNQTTAQYEQMSAEQQKKLAQLNHLEDSLRGLQDKYTNSKLGKYFSGVRSMQIGLQYPMQSEFLVRGVALRGLSMEYERNKKYLWICGGQTINQLIRSRNLLDNQTDLQQTLYNFFDFDGNAGGRKLVALKGGVGEKDGTHLYIGGMYAQGLSTQYLISTQLNDTLADDPDRVQNVVMEIDGQWKFAKSHRLQLLYGRSGLGSAKNGGLDSAVNSFIRMHEPVNAGLLRYIGNYGKAKTDVKAMLRYIDPQFRSLGLFGLRADNLRYELQLNLRMIKKWPVKLRMRNDQDNIRWLSDYTNRLSTAGVQVTGRLSKTVRLNVSFDPLILRLTSRDSGLIMNNINYIANGNLVWTPRVKKGGLQASANGMYFRLYDGTRNNQFANAGAVVHWNDQKFHASAGVNGFFTDTTGVVKQQLLVNVNGGMRFKSGFLVDCSVKIMLNNGFDPGGFINMFVPVNKRIGFGINIEKFVYGDYFNVFNYDEWKKFPYLASANLRVNW